MFRNKMKVFITTGTFMLIALVLFAMSSDTITANTLSNTDMGKILGKCGCHHKMYGDCGSSGTSCGPQCGGGCSSFSMAGSQAQTCKFVLPENDFVCKPTGSSSLCKTNYVCGTEDKSSFKCEVGPGTCKAEWFKTCVECVVKDSSPVNLPNYYCGSGS